MRCMRFAALLAVLILNPLQAADIHEERMRFPPGSTGTRIEGRLSGDTIRDYLLRAKAGQTLRITFRTNNDASYFNLMRGKDPAAIHIGSMAGNDYEGMLPADGDYRIRVYLYRSAARRNETAAYSLSVSIDGAPSAATARNPDYADGLSGGPDYWAVANLAAGDTLNVRAGPGTGNAVVGKLAADERVRNRGCKMAGGSHWCRIEAKQEQAFSGWVSGRYLVETSPPGVDDRQATGLVPCATAVGQPMETCPFRVSRGDGGTASVWITLPSGGERYIDFREGLPVGTDPGLELSFERFGDLTLIRIGGVERYEIPDAMVFGG